MALLMHLSLTLLVTYLVENSVLRKLILSVRDIMSHLVSQGSIIGPLLFNIYLNDIFYYVDKIKLINYADDNTLYAIETKIDTS